MKIENKLASKRGWFTPLEARNFYGRYSRDGIAIHHWGGGEPASAHDNIVRYFQEQARAGVKSVNYVASDNKITRMVRPENVAWTTFEANPYTISIEIQPTLHAEGYKRVGYLVWRLRVKYRKQLWLRGHNSLTPNRPTACPGKISIKRIEQEAQKWAKGAYDKPKPEPKPLLEYTKFKTPRGLVTNQQPTLVWDFNHKSWDKVGDPITRINKGEQFTAVARVYNNKLKATYYVTQYSLDKGLHHGVNEADLTLPSQPQPTAVEISPVPEGIPVPPPSASEEAEEQPEVEDDIKEADSTDSQYNQVEQPPHRPGLFSRLIGAILRALNLRGK